MLSTTACLLDWGSTVGHMASTTLNLIYFVVVVVTIVYVILDNRNPVRTIAWVLVLMFLPLVGLLLYFLFGRKRRRATIIGRKLYDKLIKKSLAEYNKPEPVVLPLDYSRLIYLLSNTGQSFPFDGNRIETYTSGADMVLSLIRELSRAKDHIHLQFYIFEDDAVGRLIRDVLIDRARAGVIVRVLYDDVGCWRVPHAFFERMKEEGIEVVSFLKVRFPLFTGKVNYRNHRKIVVIDGKVGFIGGMNLAQRYVTGTSWGKWRDTHLKISGRAVHGLQTTFLYDWYVIDRTQLTARRYFPTIAPSEGGAVVQVVTGNPVAQWTGIEQGVCMLLHSAKRYFYMQTPYFLPTETVLTAMQTAALSGVDVRLMIPRRADGWLTHMGSCSYIADVLRAGVKVYFYLPGFLHSKLMVSDDKFSTVGSTNIDFRSFEHNFEANAFVYDEATALHLRRVFLNDQHDCEPVYLKNWTKRPWRRKATESVIRLMAPLL